MDTAQRLSFPSAGQLSHYLSFFGDLQHEEPHQQQLDRLHHHSVPLQCHLQYDHLDHYQQGDQLVRTPVQLGHVESAIIWECGTAEKV